MLRLALERPMARVGCPAMHQEVPSANCSRKADRNHPVCVMCVNCQQTALGRGKYYRGHESRGTAKSGYIDWPCVSIIIGRGYCWHGWLWYGGWSTDDVGCIDRHITRLTCGSVTIDTKLSLYYIQES